VFEGLFTAMHRASHFRDIQVRLFSNCVYDRVLSGPDMSPRRAESPEHLLVHLDPDYRQVMASDACMAPSELAAPGGAIDHQHMNEEPGAWWDTIHDAHMLKIVQRVFPMFELSVDGLDQAVRHLMVRR
jgi:uncharacterized protein with von Willebrand factor type A (vWA) domain